MRGIFFAIPALLALEGGATAEPQRLDEAQLSDIAAGQDLGGGQLSLSQPASPTDGTDGTDGMTGMSTDGTNGVSVIGSSPSGQAGSWTVSLQQPASPGEATSSPPQSMTSQTLTSMSSNISRADSSGLPGVIANGWATSIVTGAIGSSPPAQ
jgi:hypothetical protein